MTGRSGVSKVVAKKYPRSRRSSMRAGSAVFSGGAAPALCTFKDAEHGRLEWPLTGVMLSGS